MMLRRLPRLGPTLVLLMIVVAACSDVRDDVGAGLTLGGTLGGVDTAGYARATAPVPMTFPVDHGPHEDFRTEWWYVTGHLRADDGRRFGYQFTLFRSALSPEPVVMESAWGTRQAYMGHFGLSDISGDRFFARERFSRGSTGLAGAETDPLRIWLETWHFTGAEPGEPFPIRLGVQDRGVGMQVELESGKGIFLNGEQGWSPKGQGEGNASYYYSMPRMPTSGFVVLEGDTVSVRGTSWLDREWSTSVLSEGQVGWDWFALQLSDGRELMVYRIRRADGSADPASEGILYETEGRSRRLAWGSDILVEETATWTSSSGGVEYPSRWRVRVPSEELDLEVSPLIADQELRLTFRYWEGAVAVTGTGPAGGLTGEGYVELTGYDGGDAGTNGFGRTGG